MTSQELNEQQIDQQDEEAVAEETVVCEEEQSKQELVDFFNDCTDTYLFLSKVFFKELNEEAIEELSQGDYPKETGNENLDSGYSLIRRYFAFSGTDRRTQLACEYARIFLAAGVYSRERQSAVPYESVFTSAEHIVMQDSRDDVVARYLEDGFKVNPDLHEPEDHLSFELEYLASMCARAVKHLEEGDDAALKRNIDRQLAFIDEHLLNWIPDLRETSMKFAKLAFYPGMLLVAQGVLEESRGFLQEAKRDLGFLSRLSA